MRIRKLYLLPLHAHRRLAAPAWLPIWTDFLRRPLLLLLLRLLGAMGGGVHIVEAGRKCGGRRGGCMVIVTLTRRLGRAPPLALPAVGRAEHLAQRQSRLQTTGSRQRARSTLVANVTCTASPAVRFRLHMQVASCRYLGYESQQHLFSSSSALQRSMPRSTSGKTWQNLVATLITLGSSRQSG